MPTTLKRNNNDLFIKWKIHDLLKSADSLTITEIAEILNIHYTTASKYLAVLEAEGKVVHRNIGMAKLFRLNQDYSQEKIETISSTTFFISEPNIAAGVPKDNKKENNGGGR